MRSIRRQPFCWQEKAVFRELRKLFSGSELVKMRCLYDTITEIDSDFNGQEIKYYTKTIHTYSGLSKDWIPKGLRKLQTLGIIQIFEEKQNGRYKGKMLVFEGKTPPKTVTGKPVNGKPVNGKSDTSEHSINKNIVINKENSIFKKDNTGLSPLSPSRYLQSWNETAETIERPKKSKLTSSHRQWIKTAEKDDKDFYGRFLKALWYLRKHRAIARQGWVTFEFLLQTKNGARGVDKILDGKYDWIENEAQQTQEQQIAPATVEDEGKVEPAEWEWRENTRAPYRICPKCLVDAVVEETAWHGRRRRYRCTECGKVYTKAEFEVLKTKENESEEELIARMEKLHKKGEEIQNERD